MLLLLPQLPARTSQTSTWFSQRTASRATQRCTKFTTAVSRGSSSPFWTATEPSFHRSSTHCLCTCTWSWCTTATKMKPRRFSKSEFPLLDCLAHRPTEHEHELRLLFFFFSPPPGSAATRSVTTRTTCVFCPASPRESTWEAMRPCWTSGPASLCCASRATPTSCSRGTYRSVRTTRSGTSSRSTSTSTSSTACHAARARSTPCPAAWRGKPSERPTRPRSDLWKNARLCARSATTSL